MIRLYHSLQSHLLLVQQRRQSLEFVHSFLCVYLLCGLWENYLYFADFILEKTWILLTQGRREVLMKEYMWACLAQRSQQMLIECASCISCNAQQHCCFQSSPSDLVYLLNVRWAWRILCWARIVCSTRLRDSPIGEAGFPPPGSSALRQTSGYDFDSQQPSHQWTLFLHHKWKLTRQFLLHVCFHWTRTWITPAI